MESMRAHSALQFLGNGAHPFTFDGLPVAPELVNVCDPPDWGATVRPRDFAKGCN